MKSLYSLKPWFSNLLRPVLKLSLRFNFSPNLFTVLNIVFGVLAGFAVYWLNTVLVLVFVIFRLACANLDGALARAISIRDNKPLSRFGFTKNEIGDRLADFGTLTGLVFLSNGQATFTVLLSVFIAAVPTVISLIGVTKSVTRINGGPFGKTERAFFVVLIVLVAQLTNQVELVVYYGAVVIIVGSLLTAWVRYLKIVRA